MSEHTQFPLGSAPQVDYGSTWADPDPESLREWRVSWDPDTGDVTSTPLDDATDVRLLGRLQTRADVDIALSGWAAACLAGNDPAWVAHRVSSWFEEQSRPELANATVPSTAAVADTPPPTGHLPAAPVARVLADYQADFGDTDTGMFARGLGLDEAFVDDIIRGRTDTLNVDQIAAVCEGLWASPYDLWEPEEARTILHEYGPERWPRTILPIDEPTPRPGSSFVSRRLDQQAGEIVDSVIRRSRPPTPERHLHAVAESEDDVTATAYSITGILAVDRQGRISEPSPANIADPDVEYHFQFTPVGRQSGPNTPPLGLSDDDVSAGPPAGESVHPRLASAARSLRVAADGRADMVRFSTKDGAEAWIGWDPDTQTWETWDDPRDHFAGPGEMIVEPADLGIDEPAGPPYPGLRL